MHYDDFATLVPGVAAPPVGQPCHSTVCAAIAERQRGLDRTLTQLAEGEGAHLAQAAALLLRTLRLGGKVLVAGNGGSAAEAQHFAAELVGRFKRERAAFAALALTTDTSALTAIANDYGYPEVFARQVQGLGRPGDAFVAFSTSGTSANLVRAAAAARAGDIATVAITGAGPNPLSRKAEVAVCVPHTDTAAIQEVHLMITHILCDIVESELGVSLAGEDRA